MSKKQFDVLVVDDDQNMRLTLAKILAEDGYSVHVASTGDEAVELCRQSTYSMVLMDLRMPGMNGVEAFREIRQHCRHSQIVLMSAFSDAELVETALAEGVLAFLRKPLDLEAVVKLIAEVTSTAVLYVTAPDVAGDPLLAAMQAHGFHVSQASDVDAALQLTRQIRYGVTIFDLQALGPAALVAYARSASLPNVHAVFIHGQDSAGAEARPATIAGATTDLRHPVQPDALIALLERVKKQRLGLLPQ